MNKVSFIEGVSPRGHININRFYITEMASKVSTVYIGHSLANFYEDISKVEFFCDNNLFGSRLFRAIGFVNNTIKSIYKAKKNNTKTVCLLSYDPLLFFLVVYFSKFMGIKLYAFEHNTVPVKGLHKYFFQYICFDWINRICYTPKAVEIYKQMGQKAIYSPHPIINYENNLYKSDQLSQQIFHYKKKYKFIVFCPSSSMSIDRLLLKAQEHSSFLFIVKTKKTINLDNVITMPFFDNYNELLCASDFLYLSISLNARVSGPFFEAVGAGKKIILQKGAFYDYAVEHFKDYVLDDESGWEFGIIPRKKINLEKYNNEIKSKLKDFFDE